MKAVTPARIREAKRFGLANVETIARVCREVGIPFYASCALFEKESMGKNVYGHDKGGALAGFPGQVNEGNFAVFRWLVFDKGQTSNGVGPSQLTWKGYFVDMLQERLKPWDVEDNMRYGLLLLWEHYQRNGKSWFEAGKKYNGSSIYGRDLEKRVAEWRKRLDVGA